jgi:hypothetical protein
VPIGTSVLVKQILVGDFSIIFVLLRNEERGAEYEASIATKAVGIEES